MDTRAAAEQLAGRTGSDEDTCEAETLVWRAHPARQRPAQAVLAIGIVATVAGFIYVTAESVGFALLGAILLVGALNRFFLPSRFSVDVDGITAAYPFRRMRYRWNEIQRFLYDEYGGYLSTRAVQSRLDAYRGMHLLFDEAQREQIIARIKQSIRRGDA